ncbi:MAG: hypothetical protein K0R03_2433 [Moraxellaceae bacterium]|jgi:hypothetical protein|nr:hypothetical protein [Moraxellaceae bacterium]
MRREQLCSARNEDNNTARLDAPDREQGMGVLLAQLPAAAAAFVMWGAWAYWINRAHGHFAGLVAGVAQGAASFTITLIMAAAVTTLSRRLAGRRGQFLLPPFLTVGCTTSALYTLHHLAGTPNILSTIAAPSSVALAYCLWLSFRLSRPTAAAALSAPGESHGHR